TACSHFRGNSKLGLFLALGFSLVLRSLALTVNDGSTTNNLIQIVNAYNNSLDNASVYLNVVSNSILRTYQTGSSGDFALRSAWYASDLVATSGVYTVTADFQPAADFDANRGGVIGWLSLASSNGVALQVVPF